MIIASAFALYFLTLFIIAFVFYRKSKTEKAFVLGNRSLNYWVTAISTQTSDMGSWLFLGYPSAIYLFGLSQIWIAVGLVFCMWLNWRFIAPRLRKETARYKSLTLWTFFEKRFNDPTSRIRTTSAIISLIYFVIYIATGLIGIGRLFEADFGISYNNGILLGALLTGTYILIGGFLAAAWCNLFQGLFLLSTIILVPLYAYNYIGGFPAIQIATHSKMFTFFGSGFDSLSYLLLAVGWGLGYFGQPHVLINFMGIDKAENMKKAQYVGLTWQVIALSASIMTGLVALAFFKTPLTNPEHLFPLMVKQLFGPFMTGLVLCGVLAAILSTVTIQIVVAASSFIEDIYKRACPLTSQQAAHMTRIATILITALSVVAAFCTQTSIHKLVQFAWSGLGSSFGPLVILSLYSKKINYHGALAAIIGGGATAFAIPLLHIPIPALVTGFIVSFSCAYLVSYFSRSSIRFN